MTIEKCIGGALRIYSLLGLACVSMFLLAQSGFAQALQTVDFGSASVGSNSPVTRNLTLTFTGLSAQPTFSLHYGHDFALGTALCDAGWTTCTLAVNYLPTYPGLRQDAVLATDNAGDIFATALMHGTGMGPQVAFSPGLVSVRVPAQQSSSISAIAVDPYGTVYFGDSQKCVVEKLAPGGSPVAAAGRGCTVGPPGDGGLAASAVISNPRALALDGAGNLFIVDGDVVRKVNPVGIIRTVAGGGNYFGGDGQLATTVRLSDPSSIALDLAGNLYIMDDSSYRIRKVDAITGVITTVAGNGMNQYSGDGGPATSAGMFAPQGVALDGAGNLFIAEGDHRVRKVDAITGLIQTIAGTGLSGFSGDGGPAIDAQFDSPSGLVFDGLGNLYIADSLNFVVRKIDAQSQTINTVAGNPAGIGLENDFLADWVQFPFVNALGFDSLGNLYLTGTFLPAVEVVFNTTTAVFPWPVVDGAPPVESVSVSNIGNQQLNLTSNSVTGPFQMQPVGDTPCNFPGTLAAGASCTASFAYVPQQGAGPGAFTVSDNALNLVNAQQQMALEIGYPQADLSATSFDFGRGVAGAYSGGQLLTISNTRGRVPLNIQSFKFSGLNASDFSLDTNSCTSLPQTSICSIYLFFTPQGAGSRRASLIITDNAPSSRQIVQLTGTAVFPAHLVVSPTAFDFGNQRVGTVSQPATFTLTNTGGVTLLMAQQGIVVGDNHTGASDYAEKANTCSSFLSAGQSCTITVAFSPAVAGARSGFIYVPNSSNPAVGVTIPLTGNGVLRPAHDFDGDGRSDYAVWRPFNGTWYITPSANAAVPDARQWGLPGDIPVGADFDGDGKADHVVWRPSNGTWYVTPSGNAAVSYAHQWGLPGDIPISADFDGDGKADFVVWRPSNGTWYVTPSSNPAASYARQWGLPGDIPISADFDGDGKADYAVWRPSNGTWYITPSGNPAGPYARQWGLPGDIPVSADFDGDRKADYIVWRPSNGTWYIAPSGNAAAAYARQWGLPGDIPISADLDGDGKADYVVWRPSNGTWYVTLSGNGGPYAQQWGLPGDNVPM